MAIGKKSLVVGLTNKATQLRDTEVAKAEAAAAFIAASAQAAVEQETAKNHAIAVEEAVRVLTRAGVVL